MTKYKFSSKLSAPVNEQVSRLLKGLLVGLIIVLPGMSGGTLILILGLYELLMHDLARLRLLPWVAFAVGLAAGVYAGGWVFGFMLTSYRVPLMGLLFGSVLASVRSVVRPVPLPGASGLFSASFGLVAGWFLAGFSDFSGQVSERPGMLLVAIASALASAAMILPGVPGSSVLIILGVYDDAMLALSRLDLPWLLVFGLGAALGIIGLSNLVDRVYARHRNVLGWLFAGLIVGSARLLIMPEGGNILIYLPLAVVGFAVVWLLESRFGSSSSVDDVAGNTNSPSGGD